MSDNVNHKLFSKDLHKYIEQKVATLDEEIVRIIQDTKSDEINGIVKKLDLQHIEDEIAMNINSSSNRAEIWTNIDAENCYEYNSIIENLNSNSTINRLRALEDLLYLQIIDTKQPSWQNLSCGLQKCFISVNNEIFSRNMKIHCRLIKFPNSLADGYLNLLKGTLLLLNGRHFNDSGKNRIFQCVKLILSTQNKVVRSLLHSKHDEILASFCDILNSKFVIECIVSIDPKFTWLKYFCYGSYLRASFFNQLNTQNSCVKDIFETFFVYLESNDDDCEYSAFFVLYFLRHNSNLSCFPIKLEDREISLNYLLESMIFKINQNKKQVLREIVSDLFENSPKLVNFKLLDLLIEPLINTNRINFHAAVQSNPHIFRVVNNLTKTKYFEILFPNISKFRRNKENHQNSVHSAAKIVDLTTSLLKDEEHSNIDALILLLECTRNIYDATFAAFLLINPEKLLVCLRNYYKSGWKSVIIRDKILQLLKYFYSYHGTESVKILCDLEILTDLTSFCKIKSLKSLVYFVANCEIGFDLLKSSKIMKTHLEEIWFFDENSESPDFSDFVCLMFVIKCNMKCIVAFLCDDSSENTVVESNDKAVSLGELLEKCLNNCCNEAIEEHLGLLVMKVLAMNLDLLLYLEANYQMQVKLGKIQNECNEQGIIDAESSLRDNILKSVHYIGFVKYNRILNENVLEKIGCDITDSELQILQQSPNELQLYLENSNNFAITHARNAFTASLTSNNVSVFCELLKRIPKTYVYRKIELVWPPDDSVYYQLHEEDFCGINIIKNYGLKCNLFISTENLDERLVLLIKQTRVLMGHRPECFLNFDWFVCIIFLICRGDFEETKKALIDFTNTQITSLVWTTFSKEFDESIEKNFYACLNIVLEENCYNIEALKILGISPEILVRTWLNQCFFNYLEFEEICNFLAFSILYPPECIMYYITAIFDHLTKRICCVTHSPTIDNIINMTEMSDFRLNVYMDFIKSLMKQYRNIHKL